VEKGSEKEKGSYLYSCAEKGSYLYSCEWKKECGNGGVPRNPRVEFEGAVYHAMCRGNRREEIFKDDRDREMFMKTLGEACGRTGWRVHAFVLMGNHYHLLLETPKANLVRGMHWFQATYTARFNARHRLAGHLFAGRYKAIPMEPEDRSHFGTVSDYIHLNPARAGVAKVGELTGYRWSSLKWYGLAKKKRPQWLEVETVLGERGLADRTGGRRRYLSWMEERALEGRKAGEATAMKRGWYLGGEEFRDRLLEMIGGGVRSSPLQRDYRRDHSERQAEELASSGLEHFGLEEEDLPGLLKSDWRKRAVGHLIKKETTVTLNWIGRRLRMGTDAYVSRLCSRIDDLKQDREVRQWMDVAVESTRRKHE